MSFELANFVLDQPHSLNFSITYPRQPPLTLQSRISVKPHGIGVHYALNNLALQQIALFLTLAVSFLCFLPDLYWIVFRKNSAS
ncbi:hypothetical protein NC981_10775 [Leptolyngbya sp. DQ-M1]